MQTKALRGYFRIVINNYDTLEDSRLFIIANVIVFALIRDNCKLLFNCYMLFARDKSAK